MGKKLLKILKNIIKVVMTIVMTLIVFIVGTNIYVKVVSGKFIISGDENVDADCILVLGAGVRPDKTPSLMLKDRLDKAVKIYKKYGGKKILVSGDHRSEYYDEVSTMKNYLVDAGVKEEDIILDHMGLSTYDSMYRAREIFNVKKVIIITQKYHMYRAIYDARQLGMEAYGVCAKEVRYNGQLIRDVRELAARVKDVAFCIYEPQAESMEN